MISCIVYKALAGSSDTESGGDHFRIHASGSTPGTEGAPDFRARSTGTYPHHKLYART